MKPFFATLLLGLFSASFLQPAAAQTQAPGDTVHAYNICFPADIAIQGCGTAFPPPTVFSEVLSGCTLLGINYNDKEYRTSGNACFRIFRTFMVVDWCAFNESCGPQQAQMFTVDRDAPNTNGILGEGVCLLVRDDNADGYPEVYYSADRTPDPAERIAFPVSCLPNAHPVFSYTQVISVTDTVRPVVQPLSSGPFAIASTSCKASATVRFRVTDNCSAALTIHTLGISNTPGGPWQSPTLYSPSWTQSAKVSALGSGVYQVVIDGLPTGSYALGVGFRDDCGNISFITPVPFQVVDTEGPSPICMFGLSGNLMSDGAGGGMLTVYVSDFVRSQVFDCNGAGSAQASNPLQKQVQAYSINRWGDSASRGQNTLTFTCSDALNFVPIEVHAWDEKQNHGFCETYIEIQDNGFVCPTPGPVSVAGVVRTEANIPLPNVEIHASGDTANMVKTNEKGVFRFARLRTGRSYRFTPVLDTDIRKGINGRDLMLLQQQIIGLPVLKKPTQWVAADVDRSGTLTLQDLKILQEVFLQKLDTFPGNTSWRFLDARQLAVATPGSIPLAQESYPIRNYQQKDTSLHFMAVKVGDLDGSAFTPPNPVPIANLDVADLPLRTGSVITVPIVFNGPAASAKGIAGTLQVDRDLGELIGMEAGRLNATQWAWDPASGLLSFAALEADMQGGDTPLFTLLIRAKSDATLADALSFADEAGVCRSGGAVQELALRFVDAGSIHQSTTGIALPNPFRDELTLRFTAGIAGDWDLKVSDSAGRLVFRERMSLEKGPQEWTAPGHRFPSPGMYTYILQGPGLVRSGTVVKIE